MKHGSLFSGIGGFDIASEWMGWENVFHCEWNEFGKKVLKYYWPNAISYDDITKTDFSIHRGTIDIVTGGFPCFEAGTMVYVAKKGYVPIERIRPGWRVLTHKGRYRKVTSVMVKDKAKIWEVNVTGMPNPIRTTSEHPFLTYSRGWVEVSELKAHKNRINRADKVCYVGDIIYEKDNHSDAFWYLVGRYLGDGWIVNRKKSHKRRNHNQVTICCSHKELDELKGVFNDAGYSPKILKERTTYKLTVSDEYLSKFLKRFGIYSYGKKLDVSCFSLSKEKKLALIKGWISSDGYSDKYGMYGVTVSRQLAYDFCRIWRSAMCRPANISLHRTSDTTVIEGHTVNQRDFYRVHFSESTKTSICQNNQVWANIKSIRETEDFNTVYNISVEEDESYTANGIAVHNCQPYSTAGKRLGKDDERHLWPEMLRAIREIQPRWVVGENVRGIVNWDGGLVFQEVQADLEAAGYEVQPFVLPAAGVNAPHERYRTWFVAYSDCNGHNHWRFSEDRREESKGKGEKDKREWICTTAFRNGTASNVTDSHNGELSWRMQEGQHPNTEKDAAGMDNRTTRHGYNGPSANTNSQQRCEGRMHKERPKETERYVGACNSRTTRTDWKNFPTQSPIYTGDDGVQSQLVRSYVIENSRGLLTEKEINAIVQKTLNKYREEAIKASGNAIVPQVALQIFKAIQQYEDSISPAKHSSS